MSNLNYHHLQYFWAVAKDGNLTRTAERLRISQSALSSQIKQLEEQLGRALFVREGRRLQLTEAGRLALDYAEGIFSMGREMSAVLREGRLREHPLRIGAVATLSRNFLESFINPVFQVPDVRIELRSGGLDESLRKLRDLELDLVLSNRPVHGDSQDAWRCRRIARQQVSLVGHPRREPFQFPTDLHEMPMLVPGGESEIRTAFEALCEQLGLRIRVRAIVDDMAMMRLLARDTAVIALLPSVVVRDELQRGILQQYAVIPNVYENFYSITIQRKYPHPLLRPLLARKEDDFLAQPFPEGMAGEFP